MKIPPYISLFSLNDFVLNISQHCDKKMCLFECAFESINFIWILNLRKVLAKRIYEKH